MLGIWSALSDIALYHGRRVSALDLQARSSQSQPDATVAVAACVLQDHGFGVQVLTSALHELPQDSFPMLVLLKGGEVAYWESARGEDLLLRRYVDDKCHTNENVTETWSWAHMRERYAGMAIIVHLDQFIDAQRTGDTVMRHKHWFWGVFALLRPYYGDCVVAAILINLLALASSMFSMNVYDRVIPNAALPTLWVLAIGVILAGVMELFLRSLRAHVVDEAGKRADLVLSAAIFRKTLDLQPKDRPASSGQYAGQLREFDSVREFVSSTTLVGLTDLPFAVLFLIVIGWLAGNLVWVPIVASVLVLLTGLVSQLPIRKSVERYQYENSQKLAFMVEAIERIETIQALGAQPEIQGRWERLCAVTARSAMTSKLVSAIAVNITQFIQQIASTALILWGVYLILEGHLTTGGLIGCSILASRALAPLAQVAGLMTRWQQTRVAFVALDRVMNLTSRYDENRTYVHIARSSGTLVLKDVVFTYPRSEQKVLNIKSLVFQPGETVAVMGPVGSGKSTLLKVIGGLYPPTEGKLLLDGIDASQVSPADLRAQIAWIGQDSVLFRGSLRENLLLASPRIKEERFLHILNLTGVQQMVNQHPQGLDMQLGEGGQALSGGQRQMVALARSLLADSPIILFDEPTSAFDEAGEQRLLQALKLELAGRMLILVTHRPGPLGLAQRLIILESGQVVADGPRDEVLNAVRDGFVFRASAQDANGVRHITAPRDTSTQTGVA